MTMKTIQDHVWKLSCKFHGRGIGFDIQMVNMSHSFRVDLFKKVSKLWKAIWQHTNRFQKINIVSPVNTVFLGWYICIHFLCVCSFRYVNIDRCRCGCNYRHRCSCRCRYSYRSCPLLILTSLLHFLKFHVSQLSYL